MTYIGVDIGGTKIYSVSYDAKFLVVDDDKRPTASSTGREAVLMNLVESIQGVWKDDVQGIGISWAGFVDHQNGIIKHAPNIPGFENFGLADFLTTKFNVPVYVENDAQLFAYAEAQSAGYQPEINLDSPTKKFVSLGIIIGTGVGAGLVVDGSIYQGSQGMAAEVGHMIIQGEEIESQLAGPAMQNFWQEAFGHHDFAKEEAQLERMKPEFRQVFVPKIKIFAGWIAHLVLAYNPHEIVFGGTISQKVWSYFSSDIEIETRKLLSQYPVEFVLRFSALKNAGVLGAGMLVRDRLCDESFIVPCPIS
jgi:glucokinase